MRLLNVSEKLLGRSSHKPDASMDSKLNGVKLPNGETVAWAVAFPKPERHCQANNSR